VAWTSPKTWLVGETLSASDFNLQLRDNLIALERFLNLGAAGFDDWLPDQQTTAGAATTYTNVQNNPTYSVALGGKTWVFIFMNLTANGQSAELYLYCRYNVTAPAGVVDALNFETALHVETTGPFHTMVLAGAWYVAAATTFTVALQYRVTSGSTKILNEQSYTHSPIRFVPVP
jgi:hypothetical protein